MSTAEFSMLMRVTSGSSDVLGGEADVWAPAATVMQLARMAIDDVMRMNTSIRVRCCGKNLFRRAHRLIGHHVRDALLECPRTGAAHDLSRGGNGMSRRLDLRPQRREPGLRGDDLSHHPNADVVLIRIGDTGGRATVEVVRQPLITQLAAENRARVPEHVLPGIDDVGIDPELAEHGGHRRPRLVHSNEKLRFVVRALPMPIDLNDSTGRLHARDLDLLLAKRSIVRGVVARAVASTGCARTKHQRRSTQGNAHQFPPTKLRETSSAARAGSTPDS